MNDSQQRSWIRRHRILVSALAGVAVLVAAVVFAVTVIFDNTRTPIPVAEAIDNFRGEASENADGDSESDGTDLLANGVYSYDTVGRESVQTFLSTSRDYPEESAITVTPAGCGVRMEWAPLRERTEFIEVCRVDGGIALIRYGGVHEFFGMRDEYFVDCPEDTWLLPPAGMTDMKPVTCTGGDMRHDRTSTVVGTRLITVDGVEVEGIEVLTEIITSGAINGKTTTTKVIGENGILLFWGDEVDGFSKSAVGDVNYTESFTISIKSLLPSR
jgi:hypothetical protein